MRQKEGFDAPKLTFDTSVTDFYDFTEEDFELVDYQSTKLTTKFQVAE